MYKRTKIEAEVHPRFLCLEEFMNYTGLGRGSAMKLGKEIGCVMKVGKLCIFSMVLKQMTTGLSVHPKRYCGLQMLLMMI